ncbi:MAG: hypothetical protein PHR65_10895 [Syntrophomonadaceae bacterium]|nr:hypothetical protein [Syntrophomonadaceae bacterium]
MPDFRHLRAMTDETGLLQFSHKSIPDPLSGYTLDDNARALIISLSMDSDMKYARKYATWLYNAQQNDGSWSNFQLNNEYFSSYDSEDSIGRALLACSLGLSSDCEEVQKMCHTMLLSNIHQVYKFRSPRAIAYSLVGICKNESTQLNVEKLYLVSRLSECLINLYQTAHTKKWLWFEDYLTYCNGILPQAMFAVYALNGNKKALKIGHDSLGFLNNILFRKAYLNIVGNQGWHQKDGNPNPPLFDQQPVDAASIALACWEAYKAIGGKEYLQLATLACRWYHGLNIHGLSLYDEKTGGCYDALTIDGVNKNQGAEAVISLLLCEIIAEKSLKERETAIEKLPKII